MSLSLSNIKPAKGSRKKAKEIGRGGKRGSFSGRGIKGQKARSGVSGLKALGLKRLVQSTPKLRGFRSIYPKLAVVSVGKLEAFEDGVIVDIKKLIQHGLLDKNNKQVKILGEGKLTKKLTVVVDACSASAKDAIEQVGGKVEIK
ncbi:MAG: 50S ribosomal protein L15 [Patescibacteria group bacterium]|jgi:large subunit ribosomal protein L15